MLHEVQKLKYLSRFKPLTNTMVHNHSNANKRTDFEHSCLLLFIYLFFRFLLDVTNSHFFGYLFIFTQKKTNKQKKHFVFSINCVHILTCHRWDCKKIRAEQFFGWHFVFSINCVHILTCHRWHKCLVLFGWKWYHYKVWTEKSSRWQQRLGIKIKKFIVALLRVKRKCGS